MKRLFLVVTFVAMLSLAPRAAYAQFGVYGQFTATHDGSISAWYKGTTFGFYGNMLGAGPVHLGGDVRATFAAGDQYHYRDFLVGPRVEVKPPVLPIKPYIQAAVGLGGNHYVGTSALKTHYSNKLQYGVIGGIDYTVLPLVDLRIPEISYIRMSAVSSFPNSPAVNVLGVDVGVVVRFP